MRFGRSLTVTLLPEIKQGRLSTATMRPAGFVAFSIAFRTENFRNFSVPQKISSEIAARAGAGTFALGEPAVRCARASAGQ